MSVITTVLPVAIVLMLGMLCRRRSILSREGINALKNVAVNIALPAVMLKAFATADYSLKTVIIPLIMFAVCLAAWFLGKCARLPSRFVPFLTTGFEAGMLGYTLFAMLYGESETPSFALIDLGQVLFVFTLYKILLNANADKKVLAKEMVTSPIIWAIVIGIIIGATGLYARIAEVFDACVSFVSAPTSVLILLGIGYDLVVKDVVWKETGKVIALRLIIMAVLCAASIALVSLLFGTDKSLVHAMLVMFILPPPFVLPVFADDEDGRVYVASALSVSTLVTIIGFAVLAIVK